MSKHQTPGRRPAAGVYVPPGRRAEMSGQDTALKPSGDSRRKRDRRKKPDAGVYTPPARRCDAEGLACDEEEAQKPAPFDSVIHPSNQQGSLNTDSQRGNLCTKSHQNVRDNESSSCDVSNTEGSLETDSSKCLAEDMSIVTLSSNSSDSNTNVESNDSPCSDPFQQDINAKVPDVIESGPHLDLSGSENNCPTALETEDSSHVNAEKKEEVVEETSVIDCVNAVSDSGDGENQTNKLDSAQSSNDNVNNGDENPEAQASAEEDEEDWEKLFDDDGDCLDPETKKELEKCVGKKVKATRPSIDYWTPKPAPEKDSIIDFHHYGHVIEIYDFPPEFTTENLIGFFKQYQKSGFELVWVDDTHCLGVFSSEGLAEQALRQDLLLIRTRPMSHASKNSKEVAKTRIDRLLPVKPRPATSASVARRLVSNALGVGPRVTKDQLAKEKQLVKDAKEKRRRDKQLQDDAWSGKCAMDKY